MDCVKGLAYVLWESMAERISEIGEDYKSASLLMYRQLEECSKELREIQENAYILHKNNSQEGKRKNGNV